MVVRLILLLLSLYCCWILSTGSLTNAQMITQPPESTTAALDTNATFSCRGTGSVLWQINGSQVQAASQLSLLASFNVFVPLPRQSFSELIVTATRVTNATRLEIICLVDPGIGKGVVVASDPVQLLVYGEPAPPPSVSVDADGLSLVATWSEPFSLKGEQLSYVVSITNTATRAQEEVTVNTTRFVLSEPIGERDCAEYQFTVFSMNSFSPSQIGVTERIHIPTKPLAVSASDVRIDVSLTSGISATINFNSTDHCPSYPVLSYTFNITDRATNSLITSIRRNKSLHHLPLILNMKNNLLPGQTYELIIEAENSVGRTVSEEIPFYTTGLQSSVAIVELDGSITVTCNFANGASSTGCQVKLFMMDNLQEALSINLFRPERATQVMKSLSFQRINNTLLHVQTVELLDGGEVGKVVFNSNVSVAGITFTTMHVPETSFSMTTLSSERSQIPIPGTLQYIIIGVVVGVFVLVLLVLIVIIACILVLLKRRRKSQDISSQSANSNTYESSVYPAYETITDRADVHDDAIQTLHNPVYNGIVVRSGSEIPVTTYPVYAEIGQMGSHLHDQRNHTVDVLSKRETAPLSPSSETGSFVSRVPTPYLVPQRSPGAARTKSSNRQLSPYAESASHQPHGSQNTNNCLCNTNQRVLDVPCSSHQRSTDLMSGDCEGAHSEKTSESPPPPVYESIKTTNFHQYVHPLANQDSSRAISNEQYVTNNSDMFSV